MLMKPTYRPLLRVSIGPSSRTCSGHPFIDTHLHMRMYVCMCHSVHADLYVYIYMQGPRQEQEREGPRQEQEREGPRQEGKGEGPNWARNHASGPPWLIFPTFFESLGPSWTQPTKTGPFCRPNHASGASKFYFQERTTLKVNADTSRVLHCFF